MHEKRSHSARLQHGLLPLLPYFRLAARRVGCKILGVMGLDSRCFRAQRGAASLKPGQESPNRVLRLQFPRPTRRGLIEARCLPRTDVCCCGFPRPTRRGLIEARLYLTLGGPPPRGFRAQRGAASLKLRLDGIIRRQPIMFPRPTRRGLIEAALRETCGQAEKVCFRAQRGAASLKLAQSGHKRSG